MASEPQGFPALRLLHLRKHNVGIAEILSSADQLRTSKPNYFPPFPLSQNSWLVGLAEYFYSKHHRGLAVLLVLDVRTGHWTRPILPSQKCSRSGSAFQVLPTELDNLSPSCRIGGSFQFLNAMTREEAQAHVPGFDGFHQVYGFQGQRRERHYFMRIGGELELVPPEWVMFDDWRRFMHTYANRITLA